MCCKNCTAPLFGCTVVVGMEKHHADIHSHCMLLQVPVHLQAFQLSQLVLPVSEFPGHLQPQELLWWDIGYTIEARTIPQPPAVWTLVLVQLSIPCLVFREAFGILSVWLQSHSIFQAL